MDATAGKAMFKASMAKHLVCGVLAVAGALAALPPAEAAPARVRFTPEYGEPFDNLYWSGEAVIDDGDCKATGTVWNFGNPCGGQFSFISATVEFFDKSDKTKVLQTLSFTGGQVVSVQRSTPKPPDWTEVISTPFDPLAGEIEQTKYDGVNQAYFSLFLVGGFAQLYWFEKNPGPLGDPLWNIPVYVGCYLIGPGSNKHCGLSESDVEGGNGAKFGVFEPAEIPEPGTLALVLAAGLGAAGLGLRRRRARA